MTDCEVASEDAVTKKAKKMCLHCKKPVVAEVTCKKCNNVFHPGCLRQAAEQKSAVCVHVEAWEQGLEINNLIRLVEEMQDQIKDLQKNEKKLNKKIIHLKGKVKILEDLELMIFFLIVFA